MILKLLMLETTIDVAMNICQYYKKNLRLYVVTYKYKLKKITDRTVIIKYL